MKHTGVDRFPAPADRLEIHVVAGNLDDHEGIVGIERLRSERRTDANVALAKRTTRPRYPVADAALLGKDTFVEVVVPGERGAHTVFNEERLQDCSCFKG